MHHRAQQHPAIRRAAFTLVETVASLVIVSLVLTGLTSAILLAGRAYANAAGEASSRTPITTILRTLDIIADDARHATEFNTASASSIVLRTDRNGAQATVTYAFVPDAGLLTRRENADSAVGILERLGGVSFTFSRTPTSPADETAGGSTLTALHILLKTDEATSGTLARTIALPSGPLDTNITHP